MGNYSNYGSGSSLPVEDDSGSSTTTTITTKLSVSDVDVKGLLEDLLRELKKLNLHMSFVTNENITDSEVEEDG